MREGDDLEETEGDPGEGPGEHDSHLLDDTDDEEDSVACPECGKIVWSHAEQCWYCGTYFAGEAWQAQVAGKAAPIRWWIALTVLVLLLVIAWSIFRFGLWAN